MTASDRAHSAPVGLDPLQPGVVLALPACMAIGPGLRALLAATAPASEPLLRDPPDVLLATLESLALLGADGEVIAAAILHACPQWRAAAAAGLAPAHAAVAALLDGQAAAAQVWALHAAVRDDRNHEGLRRLLLAIVRDLRVVPILLARQLARLRCAARLPEAERVALAQLTRDIHVPLANRLGIWQLKWELEDLAFRQLQPETYQRIARLLDDKRAGRERYIEQVRAALLAALAAQGVRADVAGRPKHIYSIWKKMQKKGVPIGELYDLRALRILAADVPACYAALGVVHALWMPVPGEFDDYIARPKRNDYRSLHTAVVGPEGKTLEVQIRTFDMHAQAELGVAAHWRYKEGRSTPGKGGETRSAVGDAAVDRKIEWMRRLLDTHHDSAHPGSAALAGAGERAGLLGELDTELIEDRIYALTPRGEVIDLPAGATPLDFAYRVHTDLGHRCRGAKVDGRIVPLDHKLRSGDRIEIMTAKTGTPRRDWLVVANGFLASPRSRDKVRNWFHKLDRARNLQAGRELLDRELKRLGLQHADPAPALQKFNAATVDDLLIHVALGDVGPHQVGRAMLDHQRAASGEPAQPRPRKPQATASSTSSSSFTVVGLGNLLVQVARCCQPLPGEPIAGYLTRGRGVSAHRRDCATLLRLRAAQPQRVLAVEWGRAGGGFDCDVLVDAADRKWLLKDITNLAAQEQAHVIDIHSQGGRGDVGLRVRLRLRLRDVGQLSRLLGKIQSLPGVERTRRG